MESGNQENIESSTTTVQIGTAKLSINCRQSTVDLSTDSYFTDLQSLVKKCNFTSSAKRLVKYQIICGKWSPITAITVGFCLRAQLSVYNRVKKTGNTNTTSGRK